MKKLFNRRLVKRSLYTGGVVGPTGGLIHYLVNDKSQELSDELTKSNLQVALLSKEKDSLTKENEDLKQENKDDKQYIEFLRDSLKRMGDTIKSLAKNIKDLKQENKELKKINELLRESINKNISLVKSLAKKIADLKQENKDDKQYIELLRESINKNISLVKSLVKNIKDLKNEVSKQKKYNEEKSQTIIEYSKECIECIESKERIKFLENEVEYHKNTIRILRDKVKVLLEYLLESEVLHEEKINALKEICDKHISQLNDELSFAENWISQLEPLANEWIKTKVVIE